MALLELMLTHSNDGIRKASCQIFSSIVTNNPKVQAFALKAGTINLTAQLDREKTPEMFDAILGSLSSFLRNENFTGKR